MKLSIKAGATSQTINVFIQNSSSTTGAGLTGLVYNTSGLTAYYVFPAQADAQITLATLAANNSAYSSGGFKEIDSTNMPGWYRLDLPNAVLASGNGRSVGIHLQGATNMAPCPIEIELTGWDNQDATAGGLSRLDAAISSRMATFTLPTNFSSLVIDANGRVDLSKVLGTLVTAATAGILDVNVKNYNNVTATTDANNYPKVDLVDIAGVAVNTGSAQLGVNVVTNGDKTGYTLTAGEHTNIQTDVTTGLTNQGYTSTRAGYLDTLNGLVANIWAYATRTLSAFGFSVTVGTNSDKTGYSLTSGEHTNITSDVNSALDAAGSELSALPALNSATLRQKIQLMFQYFAHKRTITATTETLYKADGTTSLGTSTVSNDGTTAIHGAL